MASELWIPLRGNTMTTMAADVTDILKVPGGMVIRNYSHGTVAMVFVKVDSDGLDRWIEDNREEEF